MIILQWCKMQIMCLIILGYIGIVYIREGNLLMKHTEKVYCNYIFDALFIVSELAVVFDGATAVTVNFLDTVPKTVNLLLHGGMFLSYIVFSVLLFWYWISVTVGFPKNNLLKIAYTLPAIIAVAITLAFMPQLQYLEGRFTNYSMGISVYSCFVCIALYVAMSAILIIKRYRYIPKQKLMSLGATLICIAIVLSLQIVFPEFLVSSIAAALITVCIYLNMENPSNKRLEHYHHEMVTGFATLVDNKDDSTGGHIKRSSAYAVLIAENLRKTAEFRDVITKDFLDNLEQSAPMHDIGKIGIPDVILQKPGKLTAEEYKKMQEHPVIGGRIIQETFSHLGRGEYESMAHDIALYHHEKWNGKGYPEGLAGLGIPLPARIMAVADVFDAVSAKRCYRDAMPLNECYDIIRNGRGVDFDPDIVDAFMMDISLVENIYNNAKFDS